MKQESIKHISIAEFRRDGYLQELNRRFLHPLGLALEVVVHDDGTEDLGGIWDYRDDPEGIRYADEILAHPETVKKAERIAHRWLELETLRRHLLGYHIQPIMGLEAPE